MVQVFITGDITGTVTAEAGTPATGVVESFEWDFVASGFAPPGPGDLVDAISASWTISTPPAFGTATVLPTTGDTVSWTYVLDDSNPAVQDLELGETLADSFVITANAPGIFAGTATVDVTIFGVCFLAGTLIETDSGPRRIEDLRPGHKVRTRDRGLQPVLWAGGQSYTEQDWADDPTLWPVRIRQGALGPGTPASDLWVSQQHRILIHGTVPELFFGGSEVLVAAKHLCGLPGIGIETPRAPLGYHHVLLEGHDVIEANGAPAETMYLGDETLLALRPADLSRLVDIFARKPMGEMQLLFLLPPCRPVLRHHEAAALRGALRRQASGAQDKQPNGPTGNGRAAPGA